LFGSCGSEGVEGEFRVAAAEWNAAASEEFRAERVGEHSGCEVAVVVGDPDGGVLALDGVESIAFVLDDGLGVAAVVFDVVKGEATDGPLAS